MAPTPGRFAQNIGERLDYMVAWGLPTGDTITSSGWTTDSGLVLSDESFDSGGNTTTVWVSGGAAGFLYRVVNTITTAGGRVQTIRLLFRITDDAAPFEGWASSCRTFMAAA